jgi:hypothetical protein
MLFIKENLLIQWANNKFLLSLQKENLLSFEDIKATYIEQLYKIIVAIWLKKKSETH